MVWAREVDLCPPPAVVDDDLVGAPVSPASDAGWLHGELWIEILPHGLGGLEREAARGGQAEISAVVPTPTSVNVVRIGARCAADDVDGDGFACERDAPVSGSSRRWWSRSLGWRLRCV